MYDNHMLLYAHNYYNYKYDYTYNHNYKGSGGSRHTFVVDVPLLLIIVNVWSTYYSQL